MKSLDFLVKKLEKHEFFKNIKKKLDNSLFWAYNDYETFHA